MAKGTEKQSKTMSTLSGIITLLERYPVLTTTDPLLTNFSINMSVGFLLSILNLLGVSQSDIINWLCKILGGDLNKENGVLTKIEYAIKGILLLNVRDVLTCAINPNVPDNLLKYAHQNGRAETWNPKGITINLKTIDLFGLLANCPSNEDGSVFYFDAYESGYKPNELYKSKDFNVFLWYVINKGDITNPTNTLKNTWDNRIKASRVYENNETLKQNFLSPTVIKNGVKSGPDITISGGNASVDKKQYIICNYTENYGGQLTVFLNADRYYKTRSIGKIKINRTLFEFNYDYIYSLKLFDTKTLLANICNSLLGLSASISASYSFEQRCIKEKVCEIVKKIVKADDKEVSDCYFTFSNDEYNEMLEATTESYTGRYTGVNGTYNPDYENVFNSLRNINSTATQTKNQSELIGGVIESIIDTTSIKQGIDNEHKFNFSVDFINDFLNQTITEIVLQVLSPKVAVLYAINSSILGDVSKISGIDDLLKDLQNIIISIVKQAKDILIKELYEYMMSELKVLLELFISKIALETIKAYKDLITDLIQNCIPNLNFGGFGTMSTQIDNVNYADIVPTQETPEETNC